MKFSTPLVLASALASSALAASVATLAFPPAAEGGDALLRGPLERALERGQAKLEAGLNVYVDHSSLENPWRVESQYYDVSATGSFRQAQALGLGLDQMVPIYQSILGTGWAPAEPLPVIVVPDLDAYNTAGDEWGDERSSYYSSFLGPDHPGNAIVTLPGANETQLRMWATHAAAQQFVDRAFARRVEAWIEQGLAAYFGLYWDGDYGESQLRALIQNGDYLPLPDVLGAGLTAYRDGAHARVIELGMFFSYLLHQRPETRIREGGEAPETSFQDFLQDSLRGRPVQRHPFRTWFTQNAAAIERDFRTTYGG